MSRVKDDALVERLRNAMRHIDDAVQEAKEKRYSGTLGINIEDALFDLKLAFNIAEDRRLKKAERE
jgi:hypothetical protein